MTLSTHESELIAILGAMNGQPMTDAHITMYTHAFIRRLSPQDAKDSVMRAVMTCKFRPSVAELWEIYYRADGRPDADEAWAIAPKNEAETAVVTDEIMAALAVAQSLIDAHDLVAARKAFIDKYNRAVRLARERGEPVRWWVTYGTDPAGREPAIRAAIEQGKLSPDAAVAAGLLPPKMDDYEPRRIEPGYPDEVLSLADLFAMSNGDGANDES